MSSHKAKENILRKIQKALETPTDKPMPKPDFAASVYAPIHQDPSIAFAETFIHNKGEFFFCESRGDLLAHLSLFLQKKGLREIYAWEHELMHLLTEADSPFRSDDAKFLNAEAGVTLCEALIARTGSIMVSSRQAAGRRLGIYPPVHIVVAYTSQLVEDIKDGLRLVQERYGDRLPSMISMISGPSRTADIEKTLVLGAHGPKELVLFLVEG
jgi:L-lactate dehydrogenase complex protein LldG